MCFERYVRRALAMGRAADRERRVNSLRRTIDTVMQAFSACADRMTKTGDDFFLMHGARFYLHMGGRRPTNT